MTKAVQNQDKNKLSGEAPPSWQNFSIWPSLVLHVVGETTSLRKWLPDKSCRQKPQSQADTLHMYQQVITLSTCQSWNRRFLCQRSCLAEHQRNQFCWAHSFSPFLPSWFPFWTGKTKHKGASRPRREKMLETWVLMSKCIRCIFDPSPLQEGPSNFTVLCGWVAKTIFPAEIHFSGKFSRPWVNKHSPSSTGSLPEWALQKRTWVFSHKLSTLWGGLLIRVVGVLHYFNYAVLQLLAGVTAVRSHGYQGRSHL